MVHHNKNKIIKPSTSIKIVEDDHLFVLKKNDVKDDKKYYYDKFTKIFFNQQREIRVFTKDKKTCNRIMPPKSEDNPLGLWTPELFGAFLIHFSKD